MGTASTLDTTLLVPRLTCCRPPPSLLSRTQRVRLPARILAPTVQQQTARVLAAPYRTRTTQHSKDQGGLDLVEDDDTYTPWRAEEDTSSSSMASQTSIRHTPTTSTTLATTHSRPTTPSRTVQAQATQGAMTSTARVQTP